MQLAFGDRISGLAADGRELQAAVFDEHQVRAAAGVTMVAGAVAFAFAYFDAQYVPLQVVSAFFLVEFAVRLAAGLRWSPVGLVARALTRHQPPEWVSAKPKRFAWTIGLGLAFSMTVVTNSGVRGALPRTLCLVCLTFMWCESVLGECVGCRLHAWLVRHGWSQVDPAYEVCTHGACQLPARPPVEGGLRPS